MLKNNSEIIIPKEKLTKHFKNHFDKRECEKQPEVECPENYPFLLPSVHKPADESSPTEVEIIEAIKTLKNNKCQGSDNISNEQVKCQNSNIFIKWILVMMCSLWMVAKYPSSWYKAIICCLYKNKGSRSSAVNYRGLSINATLSKVFTTVILSRLRKIYEEK